MLVDLGLLVLFGVQHSVMARPAFKARWTKIVPQAGECSIYVLFSSVAMFVLFWQWQPIGGGIWNIENAYGRITLYALYAAGWAMVLATTFMINHFDLFGLRQVVLQLIGRPYTGLRFRTPGPSQSDCPWGGPETMTRTGAPSVAASSMARRLSAMRFLRSSGEGAEK